MPALLSSAGPNSRDNHLLRALPEDDLASLNALLEPVRLNFQDLIYQEHDPVDFLYFATAGVLSQVAELDGSTVIELNTIGREGMAGLPAFLGSTTNPNRVFCQVEGEALRLTPAQLVPHLGHDRALHLLLHRYTHATIVQLALSVACNRVHSVEERMARWLLMTRDRVDNDTFPLTQEFLGQMLGVRRATVSLSAGVLQAAGLIRYSRGRIRLLDRVRLEEAFCECYGVVRDEFDRLGVAA